jgi:hypothetical protein
VVAFIKEISGILFLSRGVGTQIKTISQFLSAWWLLKTLSFLEFTTFSKSPFLMSLI